MTAASAVLGAAAGSVLFGATTPVAATRASSPPNQSPEPEQTERLLINALPGAILLIGQDQIIRNANADAVTMFGLPGPRNHPVAILRARRLLDRIGQAFQHGSASTLEFSLSRASELHLLAHIRPLCPDGDVLVAISDQTTAQRALESHRDFVANASHELKTPLTAVAGIIETLLGHARDDPAATERFLNLLSEQTVRMTRLIQDLLSLNRIQLNERVLPDDPQDIVGLLTESIDGLRSLAEVSDVKLIFDPPDRRIIARADRDEISQLFRNLVDNAIKYSGDDTDVEVTVLTDLPDDPDMIAISVRDEGPGIAREHLPRLTERFYRVNVKRSRETGGTGLGLAICKHIANRHRGRLEIQSRVDEGSTFTVYLPVLLSDGVGVDTGLVGTSHV
ncbi:MAG: sensor histidine kinase [Paracoccaceae bacterium]